MEKRKEIIIRTFLVLLSVLFFYFAINLLIQNFSTFINQLIDGVSLDFSLIKFDFLLEFILYLIFAIILLDIGIFYSRIFKTITNITISIGILLLTFTIFTFTFNSYTSQIVDDIQPSIDLILIDTIDNYVTDYIETSENKDLNINLILFSNISIINLNNKKLNIDDANYICTTLNICTNYSNSEKILFSKIFITLIYQELSSSSPELLTTPIPISTIKSTIENQGLNLNLFDMISPNDVELLYPVNSNAQIKILKSSDSKSIKVSSNTVSQNDANQIWNNLNLSNEISDESKLKIIKLLLVSIPDLQKQMKDSTNLNNLEIPLASLQNQIPKDFKDLLKYDLLSSNKSIKIESLNNIRVDCSEKQKLENLDEITTQICDGVLMTKYDGFMDFASTMNSSFLPIKIDLNQTLFNYNTLDKVNKNLKKNTSYWSLTLFLTLICFVFATITYYLHFHLFNRELIKYHLGYYIAKKNLILFSQSFLLFSIMYYLIISNYLLDKLKTINMNGIEDTIKIIEKVPLFDTFKSIFTSIFDLMIYYLVFSIIIYSIYFYLQKKEVKRLDSQENKSF